MMMLVMDIGQLVFEKIRLQNVADACAYSAATVQAAGLNEIADLNLSAELEYGKLLVILAKTAGAPFTDQTSGQNTVKFYEKIFKNIRGYQDKANSEYARKALDVAKRVKKADLDELGVKDVSMRSINPKSSESQPGKLMEYRKESGPYGYLYWLPIVIPPVPQNATSWNDAMAGDASYEGGHDGSMTTTVVSIAPSAASGSVKYKISKKSSPTTYSAFELKHAPHELILASSIFGRTKDLVAYSAAMPTGGDVEWSLPYYKPVLVRLNTLNPKPKADYISKVLH
jgi:hypothetical protein